MVPLSDFALATGTTLVVLGICDAICTFGLLPRKLRADTTRFFILHAAVNWVITAMCTTSLVSTLADPVHSMNVERYPPPDLFDQNGWPMRPGLPRVLVQNNHWPAVLVTAIHVYHMLPGLFRLTGSDYFHHLVFCPLIIAAGVLLRCGVLRNAVGWFICGAPGAIDYTLLALVKLGRISKLRQKAVNRQVALWGRVPGLLFMTFCAYQSFLYNTEADMTSRLVTLLCGGFIAYNALYYGNESIENHTVWVLRAQGWRHLKADDAEGREGKRE